MAQNSRAELAVICQQQFQALYGYPAEKTFFSPGRINIIGEHIDYNGGLVFPCAIDLGTAAAVSVRPATETSPPNLEKRQIRLYSHNFPELAPRSFSCDVSCDFRPSADSNKGSGLRYSEDQGWCNYPLGMLAVLQAEGMELDGNLDIVFYGNLPTGGSGLSSSASLEVLMGYILLCYSGFQLSRERLAVLAQRAENEFCGMHCGIMDQFIIAVAQAQHACLLDCGSLDYQQVPLHLGNHAFLIANTKLPRKLQESKYNERRDECQEALAALQADQSFAGLRDLCQLDPAQLDFALSLLLGRERLQRRLRHVVSENERTRKAAAAMKAADWRGLGSLLSDSHASLRDDYEVSGPNLDSLVALLEEEDMVLGARMTGAGFGGCSIALIELKETDQSGAPLGVLSGAPSGQLAELQQRIGTRYQKEFGWQPEFYLSAAASGVEELH